MESHLIVTGGRERRPINRAGFPRSRTLDYATICENSLIKARGREAQNFDSLLRIEEEEN